MIEAFYLIGGVTAFLLATMSMILIFNKKGQ